MTTQLSLSAFQTQTFCQISVQIVEISSQSVVFIITNKISVVYFVLNSCIFVSIEVISSVFNIPTLSINDESIFHKVAISNEKTLVNVSDKSTNNSIFIIFFILLLYLWIFIVKLFSFLEQKKFN
jgi:hypothetical protein